MDDQQLPHGWNENQIQEVIAHDQNQSEEEQLAEIEAARKTSKPPRRLQFDSQGHLIPPTAAEHEARTAAIKKMFEEIRKIPNAPGEDDRDFFRAMDSLRPDFPLFEGLY